MAGFHSVAKHTIYRLDPERAHRLTLNSLRSAAKTPVVSGLMRKRYAVIDERLEQRVLGIKFENPIGLAAGFDKNALAIEGAHSLGFGFTEIGGVTPVAQSGNSKPRMFRFVKEESLQNAMGFNNEGLDVIKERVNALHPYKIPIGINVAKNKDTPNDKALDDYLAVIKGFGDNCDYFTINVSSPNTPNLRDLQNERFIEDVVSNGKRYTNRPILIKISPDLKIDTAVSLCKAAVEKGARGIIATNTTTDYALLENAKDFGGISGKALKHKSFLLFKQIARELYGKTTLISVGGIDSGEEAYRRMAHGASLVKLYTSLVFKGPSIPREINNHLLWMTRASKYDNISELIGCDMS